MTVKPLLPAILLVATLTSNGVSPKIREPTQVTFENQPEYGIPIDALDQRPTELRPANLHSHMPDPVAEIRVRYFDPDVWPSKKQVAEYLRKLLSTNDVKTYGAPIWAQSVGVPEIECFVEFGSNSNAELRSLGRPGKLLVWGSVACYRKPDGKWLFLTCNGVYKKFHPSGDAAPGKRITPVD